MSTLVTKWTEELLEIDSINPLLQQNIKETGFQTSLVVPKLLDILQKVSPELYTIIGNMEEKYIMLFAKFVLHILDMEEEQCLIDMKGD